MGMITQDKENIQETLTNVLCNIPAVITRDTEAYILIKEVCDDLDKFINTGEADATEISVFTDAFEKELIAGWQASGYEYNSHNQTIEYMNRRVSIKYLTVSNPRTAFSVSLIPWFCLPGRPYPNFVYAYADWHYTESGQKSMRLSSYAAGKVFGIESFNKSTLSRARQDKQLSGIKIDKPQDANEPTSQPYANISALAVELLEDCSKTLKCTSMVEDKQFSPPTSNTEFITNALSFVPSELSKVIKDRPTTRQGIRDTRKRPSRRRKKKFRCLQRSLDCVESSQIDFIRRSFIEACKAVVMDTATIYHKFLI